MVQKNPKQVADRWAARMNQSTDKMREGINAVQVSPTELAAARQDAYVAGVVEAANSGKWRNGLLRVTLADWKAATLAKVARVGPGATQAVPKMEAFMADFLPFLDRVVAGLPARGTFEENKQRAIQLMDEVHSYSRPAR